MNARRGRNEDCRQTSAQGNKVAQLDERRARYWRAPRTPSLTGLCAGGCFHYAMGRVYGCFTDTAKRSKTERTH
jgi:hypothetical protein